MEIIANEEMALEGYTLAIAKMLKGKQPGIVRREEKRGEKKARKGEEPEKQKRKSRSWKERNKKCKKRSSKSEKK